MNFVLAKNVPLGVRQSLFQKSSTAVPQTLELSIEASEFESGCATRMHAAADAMASSNYIGRVPGNVGQSMQLAWRHDLYTEVPNRF